MMTKMDESGEKDEYSENTRVRKWRKTNTVTMNVNTRHYEGA